MEPLSSLVKQLYTFEEEYYSLFSQYNILYFDFQTRLPNAQKKKNGELLSKLALEMHEKITSDSFYEVIVTLFNHKEELTKVDKQKVGEYYLTLQKIKKLPSEFVKEFEQAKHKCNTSWEESRETNSITHFLKDFQKVLDLLRQKVSLLETPTLKGYDVLLDDFERGMTTKELAEIFYKLKPQLISLYQEVLSRPQISFADLKINANFSQQSQEKILEKLYSLLISQKDRFAWATTTHPFMIRCGADDIRVCAAFKEDPLFSFTSSAHECGHALHEMGFSKEYLNSILMDSPSLAMHESHSRFWENHVCMSKEFWKGFYPEFQKEFPQLNSVPLNDFYQLIHKVKGNLIRIEGDEISYGLHIIIRFELEQELLLGTLNLDNLEQRWNELYREAFGKEPQNLKEGVLQDVHWSEALYGYFPTYLLGSMYASMYDKHFRETMENYTDDLENLNFAQIRNWFDENISSYAKTKPTKVLIKEALGKELCVETYISYLKEKYLGVKE